MQLGAVDLQCATQRPCLQRKSGSNDEVVLAVRQAHAEAAGDPKIKFVGARTMKAIADVRERRETADIMITVGTLGADVKEEIDFGGRENRNRVALAHWCP